MVFVCPRKRRPMSSGTPKPQRQESSAPPDKTSDLSGLTAALGLDAKAKGPSADPLLNAVIGGVQIVRIIADGGMGRVYEGLQDKPRRPVAVKIIRPGFISREASRRFENESEVLGRLRHPYIAQVYSGGMCTVMGAEVPYFVMEFIPDSLPVTKFAATRKLSMTARLRLFLRVCDAVAHGHANNVVHRDLKPSNVLVEPNGVPKIIDFGIARCVDATPEAMTALTDQGKLLGTVPYMSPEQFSGDQSRIDARADVYALGVILYELLTGQSPYDVRKKQIFEAAEIVRNHKPVSPAKLNPRVSPALANVVETALQKDPLRRFENARSLSRAIELLAGRSSPDRERGRLRDAVKHLHRETLIQRRRTLAIVGTSAFAIVIAAAVVRWLTLPVDSFVPPDEITFGGRRYRVVFARSSLTLAADECKKLGGRLAEIRTVPQLDAIKSAIVKSGCGPTYLWVGAAPLRDFNPERSADGSSVDAEQSLAMAIMPPEVGWQELAVEDVIGGFVCEW